MKLINFLRFGLPLGNCLILCAFIETVISLYEACMDVISVFVIHWNTPVVQFMIETPSVLALNVFLLVQILADILFLWIGAILKGSKALLISWIVVTISSVIVLNVVWIHFVYYENNHDGFVDTNSQNLLSAIYTVFLYTLFYAYIISVACQCVPHMKENLEELQPIGKGFVRIWKYFSRNSKQGAQLMLTSELALNLYFFLSRKIPPVLFDRSYNGHEDDSSYPVILEEMVLRGVRVFLGVFCLIIIYKGKQSWVKYGFCIPYLLTLFLSFAIFSYCLFEWIAEHAILTHGYFFYFGVNIIYRIILFMVCFKYAYPKDGNTDFAYVTEFN